MACFGYASYSVMDALTKFLSSSLGIFQITFIINLISTIILAVLIIKSHGTSGFRVKKPHLHLLRVCFFLAVPYFALKALNILEMTEFYSVAFTSPILLMFASAFLLKETLTKIQIIMACIGFLGVLVAIQGDTASNWLGIAYTFIAVLLLIGNTLVLRKIPDGNTPLAISFYPSLAFTIVYGAIAAPSYTVPSDPQWVVLIIAGIAVLGGQIGCVYGFTKASTTSIIAPYHYTQMIWGILLGYIMFDHEPSTNELIGTVLIMYSGLYIALFSNRQST